MERIDGKQLEILVCPICKGPLVYMRKTSHDDSLLQHELICKGDRLAYPVRDGITQLIETEARELDATEEV